MSSTGIRGVYWRGEVLWVRYAGPTGKIVRESAYTRDKRTAKRYRATRLEEVAEGTWVPASERHARTPTVASYAEEWLERQHERGIKSYRQESQKLTDHVLPLIGSQRLDAVRPRDVIRLVEKLKRIRSSKDGSPLGARTVINSYQVFRRMMRDAVIDEHIVGSPCVLPTGTLPKKRDKDPTWRAHAVYTRSEIEALISVPEIPEDSRAFYALMFLLGVRSGEAAGRRWRDYDERARPLGRMLIATQLDDEEVKTEVPREMPVHPTLAAILAEWRLSGFPRWFGRPPRPGDFIVPETSNQHQRRGEFRKVPTSLRRLRRDLTTLGIRHRTQHDARRSLISVAQVDGCDREILRSCTHGDRRDVMDDYSVFPWAAKCREVGKIQIQRLGGAEVFPIRKEVTG